MRRHRLIQERGDKGKRPETRGAEHIKVKPHTLHNDKQTRGEKTQRQEVKYTKTQEEGLPKITTGNTKQNPQKPES